MPTSSRTVKAPSHKKEPKIKTKTAPVSFEESILSLSAQLARQFVETIRRFEALEGMTAKGFDTIYAQIDNGAKDINDRVLGLGNRLHDLAKSPAVSPELSKLVRRVDRIEEIVAQHEV